LGRPYYIFDYKTKEIGKERFGIEKANMKGVMSPTKRMLR
jgi:hypothetical protein